GIGETAALDLFGHRDCGPLVGGVEVAPLVAVGLQRAEHGRHPGDQLVDHAAIMAVAAASCADGCRGRRAGRQASPRALESVGAMEIVSEEMFRGLAETTLSRVIFRNMTSEDRTDEAQVRKGRADDGPAGEDRVGADPAGADPAGADPAGADP